VVIQITGSVLAAILIACYLCQLSVVLMNRCSSQ